MAEIDNENAIKIDNEKCYKKCTKEQAMNKIAANQQQSVEELTIERL